MILPVPIFIPIFIHSNLPKLSEYKPPSKDEFYEMWKEANKDNPILLKQEEDRRNKICPSQT